MGIKNTEFNLVESFFIQHSLPRFPFNQSKLFDSNIKHRAQHFVCISMRDSIKGRCNNEKADPIKIDTVKNSNFFKLLWYYARTTNVNFLRIGDENGQNIYDQIKTFEEIFRAIPNFPVYRPADDKGFLNELDLLSFTIESTGNGENRLTFQVFAKALNNAIDIYDDVTSLFSIHHDDYNENVKTSSLKTANIKGKTAMLMIAQSHSDPATLGINEKILVDRDSFYAAVHILNSASIKLPSETGKPEIIESMYRDHSKWSVNVVYGTEGNFPPLLCFYDLNRSTKQAKRGGAAFCLNTSVTGSSKASLALWELFMSFCPDPTTMARFNNAKVDDVLGKVLPKDENYFDQLLKFIPLIENEQNSSSKSISTRSDTIRKRRYSIGKTPPVFVRSSDLSTAQYYSDNFIEDEYTRIHISHPVIGGFSVPCPYKFRLAESKINGDEPLPTKTLISISKAVRRFGFEKLNLALHKYYLNISPIEANPFMSPGANENLPYPEYTLNTLCIGRRKKRSLLDEFPRIDESLKYNAEEISDTSPKRYKLTEIKEKEADDFILRRSNSNELMEVDEYSNNKSYPDDQLSRLIIQGHENNIDNENYSDEEDSIVDSNSDITSEIQTDYSNYNIFT